jgi:hypothetical protein
VGLIKMWCTISKQMMTKKILQCSEGGAEGVRIKQFVNLWYYLINYSKNEIYIIDRFGQYGKYPGLSN